MLFSVDTTFHTRVELFSASATATLVFVLGGGGGLFAVVVACLFAYCCGSAGEVYTTVSFSASISKMGYNFTYGVLLNLKSINRHCAVYLTN